MDWFRTIRLVLGLGLCLILGVARADGPGVCEFTGAGCLTDADCSGVCATDNEVSCLTDADCGGICAFNMSGCLTDADCGGVCSGTLLGCANDDDCPVGETCTGDICTGRDCTGNVCVKNVACDGDANGDGAVDPFDLGYVLARFGAEATLEENCGADVNCDGAIDPLDAGYAAARFGHCDAPPPCATCPAAGLGACCDDGSCSDQTADDCDAAGGSYQGDESTCDTDPCQALTDCCVAHSTPGCDTLDGEPAELVDDCVCALQPVCCQFAWQQFCVDLVELLGCGDCGSSLK